VAPIADKVGPLMAYAIADDQTACVLAFLPSSSPSFMALSAIFGFGFAGT
jgi:hypothetical protein